MKQFFVLIGFTISVQSVFAASGLYAVLQGATGPQTIQISVLHKRSETLSYTLQLQSETFKPEVYFYERSNDDHVIDQLVFQNLPKIDSYTFQIRNQQGQVVDERVARTLDPRRNDYTIAIASCMNWMRFIVAAQIWPVLAQSKPDILLLIGDNVYAALKGPAKPGALWGKYVQTREALSIFRERNLIPSFSTWDDHDIGENNVDSSNPDIVEAKRIVEAFFPRRPISGVYESGPGVSSHLRGFGFDILLMDDRTFRSVEDAKPYSIWGSQQMKWLEERIQSAARPIWIFNGHQIFTGVKGKENFEEDAPEELENIIKIARNAKYPVLFGSGDIHFSEINELDASILGYKTFEITSSAIHSFRKFWVGLPKNPRRVAWIYDDNFMLVNTMSSSGDLRLRVRSIGADAQVYFDKILGIGAN